MVGRRTVRLGLLLLVVLGAAALPACGPSLPEVPDADLVLILPAVNRITFDEQRAVLQPWLDELDLSYSLIPLSRIVSPEDLPSLTPTRVRDYLRSHYSDRVSTAEHPRYLGIFAPPSATYLGAADPLHRAVPRFTIDVGATAPFGSDVPYGILPPATIDGGDGQVDPGDLDVTQPTFEVFRVPVVDAAGMQAFVNRHDGFMASASRSDLALVSGEIGLFAGDSTVVQCINATNLAGVVPNIVTIFDSTASACAPDVLTSRGGPRFADVLADPDGPFHGGTILDVSHGSPTSIAAGRRTGGVTETFRNLEVADVARVPPDRLNVYISIACENDEPVATGVNLASAMYQQASVAVVSATTVVTPVSLPDILYAEVESIGNLYAQRQTLSQGLQGFRSEYYRRFVLPATGATRELLWTNVLTVGVTGDGLVSVAP